MKNGKVGFKLQIENTTKIFIITKLNGYGNFNQYNIICEAYLRFGHINIGIASKCNIRINIENFKILIQLIKKLLSDIILKKNYNPIEEFKYALFLVLRTIQDLHKGWQRRWEVSAAKMEQKIKARNNKLAQCISVTMSSEQLTKVKSKMYDCLGSHI